MDQLFDPSPIVKINCIKDLIGKFIILQIDVLKNCSLFNNET